MMQVLDPIQEELPVLISNKKEEMIDLGEKYGLTDNRTVKCSQQLDILLNLNRCLNYEIHHYGLHMVQAPS